jgi:hypothetical protein
MATSHITMLSRLPMKLTLQHSKQYDQLEYNLKCIPAFAKRVLHNERNGLLYNATKQDRTKG